MLRRPKERGESKIGCAFWLLVLVAAIVVAVKMIPVKVDSSELYDFMVEQAKFAERRPPDVIAKTIANEAKRIGLPVDPKAVKVVKSAGRVKMTCSYTVPVDLIVFTYQWHFEQEVDRPIFMF